MKLAQKASARTASTPAPTGGLNTNVNIADMKEDEALILENFWPTPNDVQVRKGYVNWATGITGTVQTILPYSPIIGANNKLFAAAGTNIYDVTSSGAVGAAVVSSMTNAKWEHINFGTSAGNFLLAVNGADDMRKYDGSAWGVINAASTPAITGVATASIKSINVFKARIWLIENNTMNAWYLPTGAIGGAATKFDLSTIFKRGGNLVCMETWTIDGGQGIDDHAVFISSQGEVAVYQGTDPASSTTFALIGVFYIGAPIGQRPAAMLGADIAVLTDQGVFPMSNGVMTAQVTNVSPITDKVRPSLVEQIQVNGSTFGWQITVFPAQNALIVNVPLSTGNFKQFVMNTITGSWATFTGWNASCFAVQGSTLYFGGSGVVAKAWTGTTDNSNSIIAEALPAFNYFKTRGRQKRFTMARPLLTTDGNPSLLGKLNVDFDTTSPTGSLAYVPTANSMAWGSMVWGSMVWGGSQVVKKQWQHASGIGYAGSYHMLIQNNSANVSWKSIDYVYEIGGVI